MLLKIYFFFHNFKATSSDQVPERCLRGADCKIQNATVRFRFIWIIISGRCDSPQTSECGRAKGLWRKHGRSPNSLELSCGKCQVWHFCSLRSDKGGSLSAYWRNARDHCLPCETLFFKFNSIFASNWIEYGIQLNIHFPQAVMHSWVVEITIIGLVVVVIITG